MCRQTGFTLLELLTVVAIIGIIAVLLDKHENRYIMFGTMAVALAPAAQTARSTQEKM